MEIGFFTLPEKIWNEKKGKFVNNKLYSWDELEEFREKNKFNYIEFMIEHMYYYNTLNQKPKSCKICHLSLLDTPLLHKENFEFVCKFYKMQILKYKKWFKIFDIHLPYRWLFVSKKVYLERMENFAKFLEKLAEEKKVKILLENELHSYEEFLVLTENYKNLGITFDLGHAYMSYVTKRCKIHPFKFFNKVFDKVENIHLMDSHRNWKIHHEHLSLGKGSLPIKKFLRILDHKGYDKMLTLEMLRIGDIKESKKYIQLC